MKTMWDTAKCVGHQFGEAGEFWTGAAEMSSPDINEPVAPGDQANIIPLELWKLAWLQA